MYKASQPNEVLLNWVVSLSVGWQWAAWGKLSCGQCQAGQGTAAAGQLDAAAGESAGQPAGQAVSGSWAHVAAVTGEQGSLYPWLQDDMPAGQAV